MQNTEPLKIGNLTLAHRAVFGPMAGFSDAACRALMAQHGAGFTVSEMVSAKAITYGDHKTIELLKAAPNGAPYGVQLFGAEPEFFAAAAKAIRGYAFDFYDINMGCPAPKIVGSGKGGAGSRLMLEPALCGEIVAATVQQAGGRPVTVKMRKGWDDTHITAIECAKACEAAGAAAIAVHARTREQMYTPGIDLAIIRAVKMAVSIPVFGNGDVDSPEKAVQMMEATGCDGVMVARAALGNPWLFAQINAAIEGTARPAEPNLQARMNAMRRQVEAMVEEKGEYAAMPQARAQTLHYMRGLRGAAGLRKACCALQYLSDLDTLIEAVFEAQRHPAEADDTREVPFP
ncbi:MAG: tRNA dihydrouridine synthase DusB [Faecalibacterium sp.]|jgi:tRNA-dihydrouridine synthase B|nr:tRNA dihydrouridine synthase DusB [Faecalibacterium sp.]